MSQITITRAENTWVVRAAGAVIGESENALWLTEGDLPGRVYFPREDVEMAFLEPSGHTSVSETMGTARYFSIEAKSGTIRNAAWSYEDPNEEAARIKDHLAFHATEKVAIEQL